MMNQFSVAVPHDDGSFISERISRVVELIRAYDYTLDVEWVPPGARGENDAFRIIQHKPDGSKYVVMGVRTEEDFNETILARLYEGDNNNGDNQRRVEAHNQAIRDYQAKLQQELQEEKNQMAAAVLRSPKSTYKIGNTVFRENPR